MFKLGKHSTAELRGVHPTLVKVVKAALKISPVDFTVHDGLRSEDEQAEYVRTGASHIKFSKHQKQEDGWGHAVDLVPYINFALRWEITPLYSIAMAMREAAEGEARLIWGGSWTELTGHEVHPKTMSLRYIWRRMEKDRRPFVDGPHFEMIPLDLPAEIAPGRVQ